MFFSYSLLFFTALLANVAAATNNVCPKHFDLLYKPEIYLYNKNGYVCESVTCYTGYGSLGKQQYHISTQTTTKTRPAIITIRRTTTTKTVYQTHTAVALRKTSTVYSTIHTAATSTSLSSAIVTDFATTTQTITDLSTTVTTESDTLTEISTSTSLTTTTTTTTTSQFSPATVIERRGRAKEFPTLVQCTAVDQKYSTSIITITSTEILRTTATPKNIVTVTSTIFATSTITTTSTVLSIATSTQTIETDLSSTITSSATIDTTVTSTTVISSTSTATETAVILPLLNFDFSFTFENDGLSYILSGIFTVDPNIACGTAADSFLIVHVSGGLIAFKNGINVGGNTIISDSNIVNGAPASGPPDYCLVSGRLDTHGISFKFPLPPDIGGPQFTIVQLYAESSAPLADAVIYDVTRAMLLGTGPLVITLQV